MISVYFCSLCWVPLYLNIYFFKFRIWITNHPPFQKNPQKFFEEIILKFYTLPFYSSFRGLLHHYYLRLKDFCFKNLCTKQALQEVSSFYLCNVSWWLILFYQCNSSGRVIEWLILFCQSYISGWLIINATLRRFLKIWIVLLY